MFELQLSPDLKNLSENLTDVWEASQIDRLPFPLAYTLQRLQQEQYAWDFLLKDMLHILLKYVAVISCADYLQTSKEPDFTVNDELKQIALHMSEGHWFRIVRACATHHDERVIPEIPSIFGSLEQGPYTARLISPRLGLKTERQGILSTLVSARNKLFGHGMSLSKNEKKEVTPQIITLLRSAFLLCDPLWHYDMVHVFNRKREAHPLLLRGIGDFKEVGLPEGAGDSSCFLVREGHFILNLFPMVFSEKPKKGHQASLLDEKRELYILNHVARKKVPEYLGIAGGYSKRPGLGLVLDRLMQIKRVWEKRQDIELDGIIEFLMAKTRQGLEDMESNNLYSPERYVDRPSVSRLFKDFLEDGNSRALLVAGASGCGKTASLMHLIDGSLRTEEPAMLLRAVELQEGIIKPKRLEEWLTAELGYRGTFAEVLDRTASSGNGRFLLVIDGLNEFTAAGRDASLLFRSINYFLADHRDHSCLKVIVNFRMDALNQFLPGSRLPPDADETVFFEVKGRHFAEIGPLSDAEALDLMMSLQVSEEDAHDLLAVGGDKARNPMLIYKIARGAINATDLKEMDSLKITQRFLDKRLGRDRRLNRLTTKLVEVMGKARDMVLTEKDLAEKAPKLLAGLQANNNRNLNLLQELEIIQQTRTEDESGRTQWAITISHDTIFEALVARQRRRMLSKSLWGQIRLYLFVIAFVWVLGFSVGSKVENEIDAVESENLGLINAMGISTAEKLRVQKAFAESMSAMRVMARDFCGFFNSLVWRFLAVLGIPIVVLMSISDILSHAIRSRDQRDIRLLYYGRNNELRSLRRFYIYLGPFSLVMVALAVVNFINVSSGLGIKGLLYVLWPVFIVLCTLIFYLPFIALRQIKSALKGSYLLKEYWFSKEARKKSLNAHLRLLLLLSFSNFRLGICIRI